MSSELVFSLVLSRRLLLESELTRDPRESEWNTEVGLGVEGVCGETVRGEWRTSVTCLNTMLKSYYSKAHRSRTRRLYIVMQRTFS